MSNAISKAEQNALSVSYEVMGSHVELDLQFVKRYLVRGAADKVSDQEIVFFMNTCKAQGLNPTVQGDAYLIKFGTDPAQMVIGKDAYLRRAHSNPNYLCKEDGITIQRGNEIIQKKGCCVYPGETLVGGWCTVNYLRNGKERSAYKEVSLAEYNKGMANWKTKPATMINKVAVSQCVRDAFPQDYDGLYSEDEMIASGAIPAEYTIDGKAPTDEKPVGEVTEYATQDQRKAMFRMAQQYFGEDIGNSVVKELLKDAGMESTTGMTTEQYKKVLGDLMQCIEDDKQQQAQKAEQNQSQDPEHEDPTDTEENGGRE